jgi:hypothetical protein
MLRVMVQAPSAGAAFNVFLAWSGTRSHQVARALHEWLPHVVQRARPWVSSMNIESGRRWRDEVARQLGSIRVGILCLTPDNLRAPWINFEAGALSRMVDDDSRVIPYFMDLAPTEISDPLAMFQGCTADEDGTRKLVDSVNAAMDVKVDLAVTFGALWPKLRDQLQQIRESRASMAGAPAKRPDSEILNEILERVRSIERQEPSTAARESPHAPQASDELGGRPRLRPLLEEMMKTIRVAEGKGAGDE